MTSILFFNAVIFSKLGILKKMVHKETKDDSFAKIE